MTFVRFYDKEQAQRETPECSVDAWIGNPNQQSPLISLPAGCLE